MQSIIKKKLIKIVSEEKENGSNPMYIRSKLKEYLQVYMLNFIFTHPKYSKIFIFTGGTALRHCFGLNRLSEDVDFDLTENINIEKVADDLRSYWKSQFGEEDVLITIKQGGRQLLQRFSVLRDLGLADSQESPVLYVKTDISSLPSKYYKLDTTLKNLYGFSYLMTHYDLESLMASKIHAVLFRDRLEGIDNIEAVKGRDFFDLVWFLQNKVEFNLDRFADLIGKKISRQEVWEMVDKRVDWVMNRKDQFSRDLLPFIDNQEIIKDYVQNYKNQYLSKRPK